MAKEEKTKTRVIDIWSPDLFDTKRTAKAALFDMDRVWRIMDGAIDVHIHPAPEAYATRMATEPEMAHQACEAGMGAIVFKNHGVPTSRSARFIHEEVNQWAKEHGKHKTDIFGGVVLNYAVGGLNPEAVVVNARVGGKYVWLPSMDASFHREGLGEAGGIEVLDENDKVVPQLQEIFRIMAQTDMVLGIGHQSTKERLILVDEAIKAGLKRIEIVHPDHEPWTMPIDALKTVTKKGAYIGIYSVGLVWPMFDADYMQRVIKEVGPEGLVAGTDCGMFTEDIPVEGMRRFIVWMLHRAGIPDEAVERIVKINARELLY